MSLDKQSNKVVKVSQLKFLSIKFKKDVYTLAKWIVANDLASSQKESWTCHTTIKGLSTKFAYMTGISHQVVESHFTNAGFYLGAIIEDDENPD